MKTLLIPIVLLLVSCSCSHTQSLRSTTGYSLNLSDGWERYVNPSPLTSQQYEALTFVHKTSKNMVVFTTATKVEENLAILVLAAVAEERPGFTVTEVRPSSWLDGAQEFEARSDSIIYRTRAISSAEYTYFIQCFAEAKDGFSSDTIKMVSSFNFK